MGESSLLALSPVLIANRGEIAIRIARTLHRLGLRSVGVFTDADARSGALHIDRVDAAVRIDSYLAIEGIVAAAALAGAAAVHPGYGFLSENAAFAEAVQAAGLVWIGPPPSAITLMGDKQRAKAAAAAAGVPVIPEAGPDGPWPVVVKALAGGGGRGLRVVRSAEQLEQATAAARREALAAFGDDRVLIELWIDHSRHVEVQVLADRHGGVVHLGERECSLQRRLQKVVEEAPSPAVGAELRARLGAAAVALARACGYEGAGTVEFVVPAGTRDGGTCEPVAPAGAGTQAGTGAFHFLEMNTRLQVEHPVTELVFGVDLVEQQLRIAAGEPLALRQEQLECSGHAIEARVYAEDPAAGFLPAAGTVRRYREPAGARVDSGVREGVEVSTHYDPLLAKVIAHAPDRPQALGRLDRALAELELLGVPTSVTFTRTLLAHPEVQRGELDTDLLERVLAAFDPAPPGDLLLAGALALAGSSEPPGPWRREFEQGAVRVAGGQVQHGDTVHPAVVRRLGEGCFAIELDGFVRRYAVATAGDCAWIGRDGFQLELRPRRRDRVAGTGGPESLAAPMPGTVVEVRAGEGARVSAGDVLLVLESMKMEHSIQAPHDGLVTALALAPGDRVERGQPLVTLTPEDRRDELP